MLVLTVCCHGYCCSGDVLLSINGIDLTHLTYNEAVTVLKTQTAQNTVTLRVIQTFTDEEEQDGESSTRDQDMETLEGPKEDDINWVPLWTRWLGLPRWVGEGCGSLLGPILRSCTRTQ